MKFIRLAALFIVLIAAGVLPASAQWKLVAQNLIPARKYFWGNATSASGWGQMIYRDGVLWAGSLELYYSRDTGKTWTKTPLVAPSEDNPILSMDFFDRNNGIVAFADWKTFITNDGGISWMESPISSLYSITQYLNDRTKILFSSTGDINDKCIQLSKDGGLTWVSTFNARYGSFNCLSKLDEIGRMYGLFTQSGNNNAKGLYVTRDAGQTWNAVPGIFQTSPPNGIFDTYSLASDPCDSNIIYFPTEEVAQPTVGYSSIYISTDAGKTAAKKVTAPIPYISGAIAVTRDAVFIPTVTDQGVLRSTDKGQTWKSIGGPPSPTDSRYICAINSDIVFVVDTNGSIWKTENSGGVPYTRRSQPVLEYSSIKSIVTTACVPVKTSFSIAVQACGKFIITKMFLTGGDSNLFTLYPPTMPDTVLPDKNILVSLDFDPHFKPDTYKTRLHISGTYGGGEEFVTFDTIIQIQAIATAVRPNLLSSLAGNNFDSVSLCNGYRDTVITFTNKGCDTLSIIQGPGSLPPEFTLSNLSLPYILLPDSSVIVKVHFKPTTKGKVFASPKYRAEQQGLFQDVELLLEGTGKEEGGIFTYAPKQFPFAALSICSRDSLSGFAANIGCDTLTLDPASLIGDADFTYKLLQSPQPLLAPKDTVRYTVYLNPAQKGIRSGYLVLTSHVGSVTRRDSVPISVDVKDGTRFLNVTPASIDFGATTLCEERDSVITLTNTGCDTVKVSGIGETGLGFTISGNTLVIPPGETRTVSVQTQLDTTGGKTFSTGAVTFTSDADNSVADISLRRAYIYPKQYSLTLDAIPDATAGDVVTMKIRSSGALDNVRTLDFLLDYNTDLLTYRNSIGKNTVNVIGNTFRISGNPIAVDGDGTIAELSFGVTLTRESVTPITLRDAKLNGDDPSFERCVATIAGASSGFTYQFLCGDRILQRHLNGISLLRIASLRPNPASNMITADVSSAVAMKAEIEIYSILGERIRSESLSIGKGVSPIHIDTKDVESGSYILRISSSGGTVSERFVIDH